MPEIKTWGGHTRKHCSYMYNTFQARSQPSRWGGGSELGWVEHYIGLQGMVGLSISWQKQGV